MKSKYLLAAALGLIAIQAQAGETLKTQKDKTSYAIGVQTAKNFKRSEIDVDPEILMKGLQDGLAGGRLLLPDNEMRRIMSELQIEVRNKMVLNRRMAAVENERQASAFLAENKSRDGVVTLPSGLQYQVIRSGDGKKPTSSDMVECSYRGTLLDGTEFEATAPGKPANLKVAQLIPGWKEAMQMMTVGSKWKLFIPPQLGYGVRGAGNDIGPNQALIFEVELLAVK